MLKLFFFVCLAYSNLVCKGDFEDYVLNDEHKGDFFLMANSDPSCWYNLNNGILQIKRKVDPSTTKGAELTAEGPYTLCQNVNLTPGKIYTMTYSLFCPQYLYQMHMTVTLNQASISTLYIESQNTFGFQSLNVTPSQVFNQFCFSQTHKANFFYFQKNYVGGILDNVTLIQVINSNIEFPTTNPANNTQNLTENSSSNSTVGQISYKIPENRSESIQNYNGAENSEIFSIEQLLPRRHTVIINFKTELKQLTWEIQLTGDISFQHWMSYSVSDRLEINIEGQHQKESYYKQNEEGMIVIVIKTHRSYDISTIEAIVQSTQDSQNADGLIQFQVYLDKKRVYFNFLTQSERQLIQNVQPIVQMMPEIVFMLYEVISSSICSYFVLSLFNFWNLSLMYNFLLINNVPNFTRNIYEIMINLIYQKGSVIQWLTKAFNISEDVFDLRDWQDLPEKMQNYRQGFSWFGLFGLSSIALVNNLDTMFILVLLIIKMIILKIIIACVSKKIRNLIGLPNRLIPFFMLELIAAVPFILISSVIGTYFSTQTPRQLKQKCLQVILLFGCISILPLWLITKFDDVKQMKKSLNKLIKNQKLNHSEKIQKKIGNEIKKLTQELEAEKFSLKLSFAELIINVSIPGLIWLGNAEGFLSINTLIIVSRSIYFLKNMKSLSMLDRIFGFVMTLIWLLHHFNYCIFYILSIIRRNSIGDQDIISRMEVGCGILAFITVLAGGGVEILRFFCEIFSMLLTVISKIRLLCELRGKNQKLTPKSYQTQVSIPQQRSKMSIIADSLNKKEINESEQKSKTNQKEQNQCDLENFSYIPITVNYTKLVKNSQNKLKQQNNAQKQKIKKNGAKKQKKINDKANMAVFFEKNQFNGK